MDGAGAFNFSESFFETDNEEPDYEREINGTQSDSEAELDREELEQILYGQIYFEANEDASIQASEGPSVTTVGDTGKNESILPQTWEAKQLTSTPAASDKEGRNTSFSIQDFVQSNTSTPISDGGADISTDKSDRKKAKKKKEKIKKKDTNATEKAKKSPKVSVDYEFECESRADAVSKDKSDKKERTFTPLAKFLLRLDDKTSEKKAKMKSEAKKSKVEKSPPRESKDNKEIVVLDSDTDSDVEIIGAAIPPVINLDSDQDSDSSDASSDEDSDKESLIVTGVSSSGKATTKNENIQLNVVGSKSQSVVLNCEDLIDWKDMNLSVDDVLSTQPNEGWVICDQDKYGTDGKSRYYTKSKILCNNCNERGHLSKFCPKPKKQPSCILCGEEGHRSFKCNLKLCFNCQRPGHSKLDCPSFRRSYRDECRRCHYLGHQQMDCPDEWRQYHLTTEIGKLVESKQKANSKVYCYNCAEEGHFGHECEEELMDEYRYPHLPFITSYSKATFNQAHKRNRSAHSSPNEKVREPPKKKRKASPTPEDRGRVKKQKLSNYAEQVFTKQKKKKNKKERTAHAPLNVPKPPRKNTITLPKPSTSGMDNTSKKNKKKGKNKKNNSKGGFEMSANTPRQASVKNDLNSSSNKEKKKKWWQNQKDQKRNEFTDKTKKRFRGDSGSFPRGFRTSEQHHSNNHNNFRQRHHKGRGGKQSRGQRNSWY